ncbi:hypothetical protein BLOT_010223 [Blomia tropicalis]|nr:hypothetical protein BLOT_010223 [Blomia tropicalis]
MVLNRFRNKRNKQKQVSLKVDLSTHGYHKQLNTESEMFFLDFFLWDPSIHYRYTKFGLH